MSELDTLLIGAINYDIYVPYVNNSTETTSLSDVVRLKIGGGASITAIALATLGLSSAVAGSVGRDADIIRSELEERGVRQVLKKYPDVETAITVVEHYPDGRKRYRANTKSNRFFTPDDLRKVLPYVARSRVVMRTGYPWMPQIAGKPTAELFDYARQHGVTTALDMSNPDSWEQRLLEELISDVVPNIDLLCANENELHRLARTQNEPQIDNPELEAYMTPDRALKYAHRLLDRGVSTVNLHYGARGTMLVTKDGYVHQEPPRVEKYENPTGCGNLQNAGVIYCMRNGNDLGYAARFANTMAVLRLEGKDFPTLQDIKTRI